MSARRTVRIGIDVGGTFTDLFLFDEADGRSFRHKLPSTPENPHEAPIQGIREILRSAGARAADVGFVGLGTTVATNALLERKGARTGLITTRGFRDLLEIGRQRRPHVYDLFALKAAPLVPREFRLEVAERVGADGSVITPLDEGDVVRALDRLVESGVTSLAVCFLNAYVNPAHERRVLELARQRCPTITVTTSQDLIPEFREYERLSSTVVNAFLVPIMREYLERFRDEVQRLGIPQSPFVMSSGGGVVTPELGAERPIDLLLSGPSGGVSAALHLAAVSGHRNMVTFDMGGTSTDVCLIQELRAEVSHGRTIAGLPIRSTSVDVHTVGAGGSSIAWIDAGGMLRVGPQSAGARPGPACYGGDGARPTVTDANVVLGRLNQESLLAGALPIVAERAVQAIDAHVATPRGVGVQAAAAAILAVATTNIAQAIRFVSVERGLDPREFVLVAFGGAGPLHAAELARELGMTVLIPPAPGVLCAAGVLTKDVQINVSQTRLTRGAGGTTAEAVARLYSELERRAASALSRSGLDTTPLVFERTVDVRYDGQNFELPASVPGGALVPASLGAIREGFESAHERMYGYRHSGNPIELVTFRVTAVLPVRQPDLAPPPDRAAASSPRPRGSRRVCFDGDDRAIDCPVFDRSDLVPGSVARGPALVDQMDTTTVIPPDFIAKTDPWGNLVLARDSGVHP